MAQVTGFGVGAVVSAGVVEVDSTVDHAVSFWSGDLSRALTR
ncbi:hypothetical protein Hhel01_04283 [Haloferula helveola]